MRRRPWVVDFPFAVGTITFCLLMCSIGADFTSTTSGTFFKLEVRNAAAQPVGDAYTQEFEERMKPLVKLGARLNTSESNLRGIVDLHAHPMSHLGFGGKLMHGAPYADDRSGGGLMPKGTISCNTEERRARNIVEALGTCNPTHGGLGLDNPCGNYLRQTIIGTIQNHIKSSCNPTNWGYPDFQKWPKFNAPLHQQMWVDWIKRAYQGGLRVMVALAVNSQTLAKGIDGNQPYDDKTSGDLQIDEIKRFVNQYSSWMEIAYSASDLRRIVGKSDKLAVIIGVELDDIGNFNWVENRGSKVTDHLICEEIQRLHAKGVRYIFPMHLIDNLFGHTAVNVDDCNVANRHHWGRWWNLECAQRADNINWRHNPPRDFFGIDWLHFAIFGILPTEKVPIPHCPDGIGHMNGGGGNHKGLKRKGEVAILTMMRLGMLVDIDHSSQHTSNDILTLAKEHLYPVVSGHNGLRKSYQLPPLPPGIPGRTEKDGKRDRRGDWWSYTTEYHRTAAQYRNIIELGGMAGVGWADFTAEVFLKELEDVLQVMGRDAAVALGTDINGMTNNPPPPALSLDNKTLVSITPRKTKEELVQELTDELYNASFPQCQGQKPDLELINKYPAYQGYVFANQGKKWNFVTEGVAHYGLIPDILRYLVLRRKIGTMDAIDKLFDGAEAFARMWEKAEKRAYSMPNECGEMKKLGENCPRGDRQCFSGRCDTGAWAPGTGKCIPNDFTGKPGEYCSHNNHCISGVCTNNKCESYNRALGADCGSARQCSSNRCDTGDWAPGTKKCIPQDFTGEKNEYCSHNNHCISGVCTNNKCEAYDRASGASCGSERQCRSKRCSSNKCIPQDFTGEKNEYCSHNNHCRSGVCTNNKCEAYDRALGASCGSSRQCRSNRCSSNRCIPQDFTGEKNEYCSHNNHCISGVCTNNKCEAYNRASGASCASSRQCLSNRCSSNRCIPQDFKGKKNEYCSHNNHCISGVCTNNKCESYDRALGASCNSERQCRSNRCSSNRCIPQDGTGNTGDFCSHNNHCRSGNCSNNKCAH